MRSTNHDTRSRSLFAFILPITVLFTFAQTASPALSVTLDPATFSGTVNAVADNQGDPVSVTGLGPFTSTMAGLSGSAANASGSITGGVDPTVSVSSTISAPPASPTPGTGAVGANPGLTYQFAIIAPTSQFVWIDVSVTGSVHTGGVTEFNQLSVGGNASALIITDFGLIASISCGVTATGCTQSFGGGVFQVPTNQAFTIQMHANIDAQIQSAFNTFPESLTLSASIDPMMSFDPILNQGIDLSQLSFEFSSGLFPTTAETPLPATLPLFASGLGALGLLGWRRKKAAQLAA